MYLFFLSFLLFLLNCEMITLIKPNIRNLYIVNKQEIINKKPTYIDTKYAAILNFIPMLQLHDIVVFPDNGGIIAIDYTPINQSNPNVLMNLLFGKNVPAEIRVRKMVTWDLEQWYSSPSIDIDNINDIELKRRITDIKKKWNCTKHYRGMNLYLHNCKHFRDFVYNYFYNK